MGEIVRKAFEEGHAAYLIFLAVAVGILIKELWPKKKPRNVEKGFKTLLQSTCPACGRNCGNNCGGYYQ